MTRPCTPTAQDRATDRRRTVRLRAAIGALLATVLAAGVAACGGSAPRGPAAAPSGSGSSSATSTSTASAGQTGRQVFMSAGCASCHTLAAAHATGTIGPNLDQLKPSVAAVAAQVTHGGGGMPSFAGQLPKREIEAVARFVATVTHRGG